MDIVFGVLVIFTLWGIGSKIDDLIETVKGIPGWELYEDPDEEDEEESQDS